MAPLREIQALDRERTHRHASPMLMRLLGWFLAVPLVGGWCFFLFMPIAHAERPPGPLLIGEVAWAGSSKSIADEWLELWNTGDDPLDLTGYVLTGAGGANGIALTSQVIAPRSALLIANYQASDVKSALAVDPQLVTSTVSLSNDTLHIQLLDQDGTVVDETGDGSIMPAGATTPTKASMIREQDGTWKTADTRNRMDDGIADFGTPGICDGCEWTEPVVHEPEPVAATTTVADTSSTPTTTETIVPATTTTTLTVSTTTTTTTQGSGDPISQSLDPRTDQGSSIEDQGSSNSTPPPMLIVPVVTASQGSSIEDQGSPSILIVEYPAFRLHRVHPAPASGQKEWVEIRLPDGLQLDALDGYALYDATGRIALFPPKDPTLISQVDRVVRILLTSAKLNNGGDTVELHRPDGSVVERMQYPATPGTGTWMKNGDETAWVLDAPTEAGEAEINFATPPPTFELPTIEQEDEAGDDETGSLRRNRKLATGDASASLLRTLEASPTAHSEASTDGVTEAAGPVARTTKMAGPVAKTKKPTIKKPSTKKILAPILITHDMLTKIEPNVRVSIRGTVATKPGIVNKNQYVLLSPDGHGLLVRGSSKQPTPAFGTTVRVSGTLTLNDDGISLGVGTNDQWQQVDAAGPVSTRTVDLNAPSLEDGWSLIEVTGTVREVGAGTVMLDLGDAIIDVKIKNASGYRAARFVEGDVLRVRGLLDERSEEPFLLVRMTDDITLVSHARIAAIAEPKRSMPDWLPFGAAGMTIAVSEGYRRLKRLRHGRRERQLATLFTGSS